MKTSLHTDIWLWADVLEPVIYFMHLIYILGFQIFLYIKMKTLFFFFFYLKSGIFVAETANSLQNICSFFL